MLPSLARRPRNPAQAFDPEYFSRHYGQVRYPLDTPEIPGLRRGQFGAIHSLSGYLTIHRTPALVVMPTGSGKTAVLMAMPFLVRAKRVLVVTPSQLVRSQIVQDFKELHVLRHIGMVPDDMPRPRVHELKHQVATNHDWNTLEPYSVVVTTPYTISPAIEGVAAPPEEFFDLLLVDEAHHVAARTWAAVLSAFPAAHKALFTATPFRRDRREIKGSIVYTYSLSEARHDNVFGDISFVPVIPAAQQDHDEAIATMVEQALGEDRRSGFEHSILVRVDSKKRGDELVEKYERTTTLKLRLIHSGMTQRYVKQTIAKMKERELDGVIAVNMLGEGFDFPNLKIAALHAPHKSLGVTLQFIGRFARVGDALIGPARFFAVPEEIEGETKKLFKDGNSWQELVVGLAEGRVEEEQATRRDIATFETPQVLEPDLDDLSLYALRPSFHTKVYQVPAADITAPLSLPQPFEIAFSQISPELSTAVYIASEQQKPKWADVSRLGQLRHELFVIYFNADASLLFICSSRRADSLYRHIGAQYAGDAAKILPLYKINRVLSGLSDIRCHNVGMRNRLHTSRHERYRIIAGNGAEQAIRKTDGRLFHRGHLSCTAAEGDNRVNIGYSSASKIWSMNAGSIAALIRWCEMLARKLSTDRPAIRAPGLEWLSVGEPLTTIPRNVLAVDWDTEVYIEDIEISFTNAAGTQTRKPLLDADLSVQRNANIQDSLRVCVTCDDDSWLIDFAPHRAPFFSFVGNPQRVPTVHYDESDLSLTAFLNEYPLHFYFSDFSRLRGEEWFPCNYSAEAFDRNRLVVVDWAGQQVNIQKEYWKPNENRNGLSIHDYLERVLNDAANQVVFYDHRSGEVADFLVLDAAADETTVRLFHCKKSGGAAAADRVDDVYDVCGQVIKSFNLVDNPDDLVKHVRRRSRTGSRFVRGDFALFDRLMSEAKGRRLTYQLVAVQPGISQAALTNNTGSVLAAANDYVHQLGAKDLLVWASA